MLIGDSKWLDGWLVQGWATPVQSSRAGFKLGFLSCSFCMVGHKTWLEYGSRRLELPIPGVTWCWRAAPDCSPGFWSSCFFKYRGILMVIRLRVIWLDNLWPTCLHPFSQFNEFQLEGTERYSKMRAVWLYAWVCVCMNACVRRACVCAHVFVFLIVWDTHAVQCFIV